MTTKLESPSAPPAETSVLDRVLEDDAAVRKAAEEILWKLQPDKIPTPAERNVLRLAGILDRNDLDREMGRVGSVRQLIIRAGTSAEFRAVEKAAIAAVQADRKQRPDLEARLATITAELGTLAQARDETKRALHSLTSAREGLREPRLLPAFLREAYQDAVRCLASSDLGRRIRELNSTIGVIDALQQIDLGSEHGVQTAKLHCEAVVPQFITRTVVGPADAQNRQTKETFDTNSFRGYRDSRLKVERPKCERELNELQDEHGSALAKISQALDHYVDQIK